MGGIRATLRLVSYDENGKELSRTTEVRDGHTHRLIHTSGTTRSRRKTLQVAWDDYGQEFNTIDWKVCKKNDWKIASGVDPNTMYLIEAIGPLIWRITCKECGTVFSTGGGPP